MKNKTTLVQGIIICAHETPIQIASENIVIVFSSL